MNRIRDIVHLGEYGNRKINELSGGQQQRVALARALVIEPDILLLDEPLSNLDAKLREETRFEIKRIQSELGVTTIYVTHDQTEAMAMSDRIMVMENGEVKQFGTPQEIYNRPVNRFVSNFIGESNTIEAKIETVSADDITVQTKYGMRLRGKKQNVSPLAQLNREQTIYVSVRPELIQYGPGENEMVGTISFVEFTGLSAHYLVKMQNFTLKVMILNDGSPLKKLASK